MKSKNLFILGIITVGIIAVSMVATYTEERTVTDQTIGKLLFENLQTQTNNISHIEILQGKNKTSISKVNDTWVVEQKYKQPANLPQLKQLLLTLASATIIERKTKRPQQYSKLGVEDVGKGAKSLSVTFKTSGGDVLAGAIIGRPRTAKSADSKDALYIRKIGDPQSWLVTGKTKREGDPAKWLIVDLLSIARQRIKSVTINHPDEKPLKIEKKAPTGKDYTLLNIPNGKQIRNAATVNNLALGLKNIKLEDIFPKNEIEFDKALTTQTRFVTYDGLIIDVKVMKKENIWYTAFNASADEAGTATTKITTETKPADATPAEPENNVAEKTKKTQENTAQNEPIDVSAEAAKLNKKFNDWVYAIPSYKAVNFNKKMGDLAKDKDT